MENELLDCNCCKLWDPEKLSKLFFAKKWPPPSDINLLRLHGDDEENILHSVNTGNYTVKWAIDEIKYKIFPKNDLDI